MDSSVTKRCARCGRAFDHRAAYQHQSPSGLILRCLTCSLRDPSMLRRSTLIALAVGTILTAVNQGDVLLAGHWPPALLWKLPMTYAVPFIVAMIGALGAEKVANRSENLQPGGASAIRETEQR